MLEKLLLLFYLEEETGEMKEDNEQWKNGWAGGMVPNEKQKWYISKSDNKDKKTEGEGGDEKEWLMVEWSTNIVRWGLSKGSHSRY